jgi:hypothetical protein
MYSQLTGALVPTTQIVNGHTWVANSDGLYVTTANLAAEWQGYYQQMLAGNGASLTAMDRLEGNAEAVFENTGLAELGTMDATQLAYDRMDAQREIDAIVTTEANLHFNPANGLSVGGYLLVEHALAGNAALEELAIQGHGLNNPISPIYDGFTNDFQTGVDDTTLYVGPGPDSGERALNDFFDDDIMSHLPFPSIAQSGELEQLNQDGDQEATVQQAVDGLNEVMFGPVLTAVDFGTPGTAPSNVTLPSTATETFFGGTAPTTLTLNGHTWTIGTDGKYHTTTDLEAEWKGYYQIMLAGKGASLTDVQRLEGNAEAVFENTSLSNTRYYNYAKQQFFREDAQREFDAIAYALDTMGLNRSLLNAQTYVEVGQVIQSNAALEELAVQGHGLNNPPLPKYDGYTQDFQNNSDNSTYYVGGGLDSGETAVPNLFDDAIISHLPFPVVTQWGTTEQLNQDGMAEDTLANCVAATNDAMYRQVYVAADFSKNPNAIGPQVWVSTANENAAPPASPTAGAGQMLSLSGQVVPTTITVNGDTWVADANGEYQTTTDLALAWYKAYQAAQAGATLTVTQHWEAQAEAVFLNTGLGQLSEAQQAIDRADVQREIDAVVAAMTSVGQITAGFSVSSYLRTEHALQDNAAWEELALQGHGISSPPSSRYDGFLNDFQWNDYSTLFVGPSAWDGQHAIADMFGDLIMPDIPFASIAQDGELVQLDQNGNEESTVSVEVNSLNQVLFGRLLTSANFLIPGALPPPPPAAGLAATTGLEGDALPASITANGHTWTLNADGVYVTTANLEIEWRGYYQTMLAGKGNTLTATQRLEGNAEAVFENTGISQQPEPLEAQYRMDVQREIDAIAGAMSIDQTTYGIDPSQPLTESTYIRLGDTLRADPELEELALQGYGIANPPSPIYDGASRDLGSLWLSTDFVGGGSGNGQNAITYLLNGIMSDLPFATAWQNGKWEQLDVAGNPLTTVEAAATLFNTSAYSQVYVASDFNASATATGAVMLIPGAPSPTATPISAITPNAGMIVTLDGSQVADTMIANGHTWTAGADGLFHTASLASEWSTLGQKVLSGQTSGLTTWQVLEGNADVVLRNTSLATLTGTALQAVEEDVQRVIDAEEQAAQINATTLGIPATATLVHRSYVALERTLQTTPALAELAVQGEGLSDPPSARYDGYRNDFATTDTQTNYVGTEVNSGRNALSAYMVYNIMMDTPFALVWHNGALAQLNQNGTPVETVDGAAAIADASMTVALTSANFKK